MSAPVTNRRVTFKPGFTPAPVVDVKDSPTTEQWRSYQGLYDYLNAQLWDGRLPPCVLNFSRHAGSNGFFVQDAWRATGLKKKAHEISLNPDHLSRREMRATVSTLAHEMVHCWQAVEGTPGRRHYHNAEWAAEMERIGLVPSSTGEPGGKRVGQRMTHYIDPRGLFAKVFPGIPPDVLLPWQAMPLTSDEKQKKAAKQKVSYTCDSCECKVWGKAGLKITCRECDNHMHAEGSES